MKTKIYVLLIVQLSAGLNVSAQMKKGIWFLNGLNIASYQSGKIKNTSYSNESKSNFSSFTIGPHLVNETFSGGSIPTINYAFSNHLSGGISVFLISSGSKDVEKKSVSTISMIGPSLRCYLAKEKKFQPFAEAKAGIGSLREKNWNNDPDHKIKLSGWYLGTGATYFFLPKTGLDLNIGYQSLTSKYKKVNSDFKGISSGIDLGIGILVGF